MSQYFQGVVLATAWFHAKSDAKMNILYKSYIEIKVLALVGPFCGSLVRQLQVSMNYVGISVFVRHARKDKICPI